MASIDISGAAARRAQNVQQVTAANLVQDPLAASIKPLFVMFLNKSDEQTTAQPQRRNSRKQAERTENADATYAMRLATLQSSVAFFSTMRILCSRLILCSSACFLFSRCSATSSLPLPLFLSPPLPPCLLKTTPLPSTFAWLPA